jgi:ATP-dependent 26S proteasome regulatory subunit
MSDRRGIEERIVDLLRAGYPIVSILSWEEDRVEKTLERVAQSVGESAIRFVTWSATTGLLGATEAGERGGHSNTKDPLAAVDAILGSSEPAIYLLKDLHPFVQDNPVLVRRLRDAYFALRGTRRFVFIVSPSMRLPEDLRRMVQVVDFPLPTPAEVEPLVLAAAKRWFRLDALPRDVLPRFVVALLGLTLNEAAHTLNGVFQIRTTDFDQIEQSLLRSKAELVRKEGVLEHVPQSVRLDGVGGLSALKEWLSKRTKAVIASASGQAGVPMPRGLLVMGVSGCGKSLAVKAISQLWGLPLYRLDMNVVFSEASGTPEEVFLTALKIIEAMAPAILWLDEIEMGLSAQAETGAAARIFGHFLTWMQERRAPIFVAATANRIDLLPAELIRRGRFDQVFFVDLPTEEERKQIFRIHLLAEAQDPSIFDFIVLAQSTKGWNGAEIEQAVASGIAEAFNEERGMTMLDLQRQIYQTIPLSTTMQEQIKQLRSWAQKRARNASGTVSGAA